MTGRLHVYCERPAWQDMNWRIIFVLMVQILLAVSLDVSLGVLRLLLSDVECLAKWFTAAIKCCLDAGMIDAAITLCYLLLPYGNTQRSCLPVIFLSVSSTVVVLLAVCFCFCKLLSIIFWPFVFCFWLGNTKVDMIFSLCSQWPTNCHATKQHWCFATEQKLFEI